MHFEIVGEIDNIETIAVGGHIRDIMRFRKQFGTGRWRKLKGIATVRLPKGRTRSAELHWYEAHGIGKKKMKIQGFLTSPDETSIPQDPIRLVHREQGL